jgi:uncharacterized protein YybS (DUF2232 family)
LDRTKSDGYKNVAAAFLVAAALILISTYFPPAAAVAAFVLAYAVAMWGKLGMVVAFISFAISCFLDVKVTAFLAAAFLPQALAAGIVIKKRLRMRDSVMITSSAALAGYAAAFGVLWLFTGLGPIDYVVSRLGSFLGVLHDGLVGLVYQYTRAIDMFTGAITQAAVFSTPASEAIPIIQERLREFLNLNLVNAMLTYALLTGLLIFVITRVFVKKKRKVVSVPPFSALTLPPRFWLAYLASYVFAFAGISFGWPSFQVAAITISGIYGFVFIVQALSFLDYLYKRRQMQTAVRVLLHVVVTLLIGNLLVWVGMFENMAGLRKRMDTEGGIVS